MISKKILICEDTPESIFTAIYEAWTIKCSHDHTHDNIRILVKTLNCEGETMELFSEYIPIKADGEKAGKVAKAIREKISEEAYGLVCNAVLSESMEKGDMIYRFLILGFSMGAKVVNHMSDNAVMNVFNLSRNVGNEVHHYEGFLRFSEGINKILLGKISPKNNILQLLAPHFSDRLNTENFVIYDERRKSAVIHGSGLPWVYTPDIELNEERLEFITQAEDEYRLLWKSFFDSIAIQERKNYKLQRSNLPLRFRKNLTEFK